MSTDTAAMPLLVYGSRDFGRVVRDLLERCGHQFVGYVDDVYDGDDVVGSYLKAKSMYPPGTVGIAIAIGYGHLEARWKIFQQVVLDGYRVPTLIHPTAYVRDPDAIGQGAVIMAGAIVDVAVKLGELTVLWPGAVINHDSVVGANSFISPNATVCGFVTIGQSCFVGAGAVIVDHRSVPDHGFVKAGHVFH